MTRASAVPRLLLAPLLLAAVAMPQAQWAEAEVDLAVPAESRALGHHGVVTLEGDIAEGRAVNLVVAKSSRSPTLDALALKRFTNAPIGADLRVKGETKIRIEADFNNADYNHMGIGYLCGQAVLDADWFDSVSPGMAFEPNKFSSFAQGLGLMDKRWAFAMKREKFEKAWREALAFCRTHADASFLRTIVQAGTSGLPK